ncbi:putative damage-inducible protein DinB [Primorskyibacter sedentarius]|uniref:Putative damage-inducible protein DinB n=2 Tax=Primorskyibacter sedentarius TaxID=745311 RepID=A0A4R3JDD0_9RHOB|nr:putative damage-inducible protein DinB [Primorskyibacter sedentarius]
MHVLCAIRQCVPVAPGLAVRHRSCGLEREKGSRMISPEYVLTMARYNAWQNRQLRGALERMTDASLRLDRGAFFRSIFETVNHLLWADQIWMARLDGGTAPKGGIPESHKFQPTLAAWSAERFRTDGRILGWAEALTEEELKGDLKWYSQVQKAEQTKPKALCIVHLFNHQTHHRGQVHAMVTAAKETAPTSDLPFMPANGPWL